ncbi:diguanylate cyclase [Krasilnikovia sp. MM14-A1259]|uniref:GGDEF domain-containing protein n=1 Tax=Krasilnikovia sp. MM14-A1259 TaxID=3373539 RepID=UPI00399C6B8C
MTGDGAAEDLAAQLSAMEHRSRYDGNLAETLAAARRIEAAARRLGRTDLQMRGQLVQGDVLGRRGQTPASGRIFRKVNRWAIARGDTHLLALSHRRLSLFFGQLGDFPLALEHAVKSMEAIEALGDQAVDVLRFRCTMTLADALADSGDVPSARMRYADAQALVAATDRVRDRILVWNNIAYTEYEAGDTDAALRAVDAVRSLAAEHRLSLDYNSLDTAARVWLQVGRYADAVEVLQPVLDDAYARQHEEIDSRADGLLTLTEAYRGLGDLDAARATLTVCRQLCQQRGLAGVLVQTQREEAEILAALGLLAEAFACFKAYHAAAMAQYSAERDARAQTMQAIYEANEARRAGRRALAQALSDPLTGLYNRRFVDAELPLLLDGATASRTLLSVALVDLDHFKRINDTCSHEVGDKVLQVVSALLADVVGQPTDGLAPLAGRRSSTGFAARLGGEEFLLVLPGTDADRAFARLEELRRAVREYDWRPITGAVPVSASIGVTTSRAGDGQASLLRRADANLYLAKGSGRDRTIADSDQCAAPSGAAGGDGEPTHL